MEKDFEDGGELFYNVHGKRKDINPPPTTTTTTTTTREDDALYGVFAYNNGSNKRRKHPLSTKPLNFVSTGSGTTNYHHQQEEIIDHHHHPNSKPTNGYYDEDEQNTNSAGLGLNTDDDNFLPTAFGKKIKEGAQQREIEKSLLLLLSIKKPPGSRETDRSNVVVVGEFERHTRGIGMKLLAKMGYRRGGGLGKNEQGIVAPIEAKLRPKSMGMGFNDYKEAANFPSSRQHELEDNKSLPHAYLPARSSTKEKIWSKQAQARRLNKKNKEEEEESYLTAEELLAKKQNDRGSIVVEKVLDMRGPQVRVLTNLENLNAEEKARENNIFMPELQHNLKLIIDLAGLDIQKVDRELRNERENVVALQKEKETLKTEVACIKMQLDNREEIVSVFDQIDHENLCGTLTLDSLAESMGNLQRQFTDEYKLCNLWCIASSFAQPLLIKLFRGWNPIQNPTHGLEVVSFWKNMLQGEDDLDIFVEESSYDRLFIEVVFPALMISLTNTWQARDPEPMLRFLETWVELLPSSVLQNILDDVVMPKLSAEVDSWDSRWETVPIHSWVHPWLPWKDRFDPTSWKQLMARYIVPKLLVVMREFEINTGNQRLDQFNWVQAWATIIPIQQMLQLMDLFFNKWQEFLGHWLCSHPNFDEVGRWFLGWKELIPPEIVANEHIQYRLNLGLDMMNQAVEGKEVIQPVLKDNISYLKVLDQRQFEAPKKSAVQAQQEAFVRLGSATQMEGIECGSEMSLKEVIEAHAQDNGLQFRPKPGRMQDGHQIYGFGNISIILDTLNQKVFAQIENRWSLVSLGLLLELQNRRGLKCG